MRLCQKKKKNSSPNPDDRAAAARAAAVRRGAALASDSREIEAARPAPSALTAAAENPSSAASANPVLRAAILAARLIKSANGRAIKKAAVIALIKSGLSATNLVEIVLSRSAVLTDR